MKSAKGIACIVLSAFSFALMSAFVSLAGDLPFFQKVLFRNAVSALVSGSVLLSSHERIRIPRAARFPLTLRTVCGTISVFCNYYAIDHLMLASSNSLSKMGPFFAIVFAALFLKEQVKKEEWGCIALAGVACLLLLVPNFSQLGFSSSVGLMGGLATGVVHTSLRYMRKNSDISTNTIVFVFSGVSTLITAVPCLLYWQPISSRQLLYLLGVGAASASAQYFLSAAYRYAPPKEISIFDCTQIIFSGVLGYIIFRQIPGLLSFVAYGLILLASALLSLHYRRERLAAEG